MGIYTTNFIVAGTMGSSMPIYTNTMSASNFSNVSIDSDVRISGDIYSTGRLDVGRTIFTTFRLSSNIEFAQVGGTEVYPLSNLFVMDMTHTDVISMAGMQMAVPQSNVYNQNTGQITVPVSGLYSIQMQGSFSNTVPDAVNGVYLYLQNRTHSNVRVAPMTSQGPLISTSFMSFMLGGDTLLPTYYSSDPNAVLVGAQGETFVSYSVAATFTPLHNNYPRV